MIENKNSTNKRKRGVILTSFGWQKLQQKKTQAESEENFGKRYTLEDLSERTGLAIDTLVKIWKCEVKVDKQTLRRCFNAFNLVLKAEDYFQPKEVREDLLNTEARSSFENKLEWPAGQVPLESHFYVERPPIESNCYKAVLQPGALIRIKAPRRMGKTSLMSRILNYAASQGYKTALLSLRLADRDSFENLDKFLRWFCASVCLEMQLPNRLAEYWEVVFGSKISSKIYFEQYILTQIKEPLVLFIDEIDWLFQYPHLAEEFLGLLRSWHESAKIQRIWKKFHLVVAHSAEVYIPLNINRSPFNVGLPIELPEFTCSQVQDLAKQHGLNWSSQEAEQLMTLVGGLPYLVRIALYHIQCHDVTLEQLLSNVPSSAKIYSEHLQQQWLNLKQNPELEAGFAKVVTESKPVELDLVQAFKLQGMGLVNLQGNKVRASCQLYNLYFRDRFVNSC